MGYCTRILDEEDFTNIKKRIRMNKLEVIQSLCTNNGLSKAEATKIVSIFFEQMAAILEKGDRVEIRGLCSLYVKHYEGYLS